MINHQGYNSQNTISRRKRQRVGKQLKFGIRDLLGITFLVALAMLVIRGKQELQRSRAALLSAAQHLKLAKLDLDQATGLLADADGRMDYFHEVAEVHRNAVTAFEKIQSRYHEVVPKPDSIGLRLFPVLKEDPNSHVWSYRISVPEEPPVFLRTAVSVKDSFPREGRSDLDHQQWLDQSPFDALPGEIQLSPGIHDIVLTQSNVRQESGFVTLSLKVDQQTCFKTTSTHSSYRFRSSSSTAPKQQYDLRLAPANNLAPANKRGRLSSTLVSTNLETSGETDLVFPVDYTIWLWLSSTPMPETFAPFSVDQYSTDQDSVDQSAFGSESHDD
ncbi:hypothetical protein [Rhodopirellula sp. MGV]|uniref:hypothetical protein n=1 Tax=Rhodopirellula sp. MGV TaxID=2023130 RepID=UPI000BC61E66|nr:hypothetical protein [Rhodopirellula sp. MGV]OYP34125.1 hypothetical protein CGZ80_15810 [Rhodopirellula sp. MGV]